MIFREIHGDLFTADNNASLAHCVSKDLNMGKGIATSFVSRYGNVDALKSQRKNVGEVAGLRLCNSTNTRTVFYMITKSRYFEKPTYHDLVRCLKYLARYCDDHEIKHLCMPRIGCGLDRLEWKIVKESFKNLDIRIDIYYL